MNEVEGECPRRRATGRHDHHATLAEWPEMRTELFVFECPMAQGSWKVGSAVERPTEPLHREDDDNVRGGVYVGELRRPPQRRSDGMLLPRRSATSRLRSPSSNPLLGGKRPARE